MAIKFLQNVSLEGGELQNFVVYHVVSDPDDSGYGTSDKGRVIFNSTSNVLKFYNGTDWITLSSSLGDITSVQDGNGLTGGADSGDVTLAVGQGTGITVNTNDVAVSATQTGITSILNTSLVVGRDADNQIKFGTDNQITFRVSGTDGVVFKASGEIEATKFDGALEGNADTATALATARAINGVDFDGTAAITVTAAAGTLTGSTLNSSVTASSLTSVGTITTGTWQGTAIASAYLDPDTAHLSGTQTFTGSKSFDSISIASGTATNDFTFEGNVLIEDGSSIKINSASQFPTFDFTSTNLTIMTTQGDTLTIGDNVDVESDLEVGGDLTVTGGDIILSNTGRIQGIDTVSASTDAANKAYVDALTLDDVSNTNLLSALANLESSGGAANENIVIGTDSDDTIVITGNLQVLGTTTTLDTQNLTVEDNNIILSSGNATSAAIDGAGITLEGGTGDDVTWMWSASNTRLEAKLGASLTSIAASTFVGNLTGNASTATTATTATNITAVANNSANETVYLTFVDGATGSQGIETDTGLSYNPSTGVLTTTSVSGNLTGDVTGDVTGNADTATSLETARTIGGVSFNGTANIDLPGVNTTGNQDTSGNAATATKIASITNSNIVQLTTTQTLTNKTLTSPTLTSPALGTPASGNLANCTFPTLNQNTTGSAATLTTARTINGEPFDGSADISTGYVDDTIGDTSATSITVNHGLGSRNVIVQVFETDSPYDQVFCEIERTDANNVELKFRTAPGTNEYTCVVNRVA